MNRAQGSKTAGSLAALGAGMLFGIGLVGSRMTDPRKVLAFLNLGGSWDPSLLFVMAGAVLVYALGFRLTRRFRKPLLGQAWALPARRSLDVPLVGGAVLFGVGWGLSGYCPGPAVVALGALRPHAAVFVLGVVAGTLAVNALRRARRASATGRDLADAPLEPSRS